MDKLDKAIALMTETGFLEEQVKKAAELRRRQCENELVVSVVGQFKREKSSLINAMIKDDLLPVGIIPLTTVVTEIRRADRFRAVVCFHDGSEREIERGQLPDYISEQKNRANHMDVAAVKLWVTSELFGDDVTLVDTPGVGSVHRHNTDTSHAFIEKSDAVLFLLSVDSPVSEVELEFLLKVREHASKFYFAVNKIDTISRENLAEFISYCAPVLSEAIGSDVGLYPLSAETGEGVPEIMKKISADIRKSHHELLTSSIAIKMDHIIRQAKSKIELYLKAAEMPVEELKGKISQIKEKQSMLDALSDEVQVLTKRQTDRLVERIQESLEKKLPEAVAAIRAEARQSYEELKSLPSKQFEQKITAVMECVVREKIMGLNHDGLGMLQEGYAVIVGSLNKKAADTAQYVREMVLECFGMDYPVIVREYPVSKRSDYFIRLSRNGSIYLDTGSFTHILPRAKANAKIFERALAQAANDVELNKNNMLYNYRYKMQESLRTLCGEFSADIEEMNSELTQLLTHIERGHSAERRELEHTRARCVETARALDRLQ